MQNQLKLYYHHQYQLQSENANAPLTYLKMKGINQINQYKQQCKVFFDIKFQEDQTKIIALRLYGVSQTVVNFRELVFGQMDLDTREPYFTKSRSMKVQKHQGIIITYHISFMFLFK